MRSRFVPGIVIGVLVAAGAVLWWALGGGAGRIDVPAAVAEPCATWAADMPRYFPSEPPPGWSETLVINVNGRLYVFGPIEGHLWRVIGNGERICGLHYNTMRHSASAVADGMLLYVVEGVRADMPVPWDETPQPEEPYRILEYVLDIAPAEWLATRPPEAGYVYWRSAYDAAARVAVPAGYWLRHVAVMDFRFDEGDPTGGYPFTHDVRRGVDTQFAPKIKFDAGP